MEEQYIKAFVLAGNSTFTLQGSRNKQRRTFKVKQDTTNLNRYFVKTLVGADNEQDYRYIGLFYTDSMELYKSAKSQQETIAFAMFSTFIKHINHNKLPEFCEFYPSGKCGRCGRKLTTPESITLGLGPECATKL